MNTQKGGVILSTETIGSRIRYLRKDVLDLTLKEMSSALSISLPNLANIEKGNVNTTQRIISDICRVYNGDPSWLESGDGEMFHKPSEAERFAELAAKIQSDPNEFKKRVFYALSLMSDEGWAAFEQAWNESEKKEKDTE